jgi:FkbM family methyltransferase
VITKILAQLDRLAATKGGRLVADSPIGGGLKAFRRRLPRSPPSRPIAQVIYTFAQHHPEAFVVQVGAHDGTALDPLRDELMNRPWRGILIEPVPYVFERLRANYGQNPRLALENVAIADADGVRDFHHIPQSDPGSVWKWYDALGSFRREVVLKHRDLIPDIEDRIVATPVRCMTFTSLCEKHDVDAIDFVQIDTEGYDLEVLRLIDLGRWQPRLVMYEHLHLEPADRESARALLDEHGYLRLSDDMDTLGIHRSTLAAVPELDRLWKRLTAAGAGDGG